MPGDKPFRTNALVHGLLLLGLGIVFTVDWVTPLSYAVWLGYVGLILGTLFINDRGASWLVAGTSTVLIVLRVIVSPPGVSQDVDLVNRMLCVALLWIGAALLTTARDAAPIHMLSPSRLQSNLAVIMLALTAGLSGISAVLFWPFNQVPFGEFLSRRVPVGILSVLFLAATGVGLFVSRRVSNLAAVYTKALRDKEQTEEKLRRLSGELENRVNERTTGTAPLPQYGNLPPQRKAGIPVLLVDDHAMVRQGLRSVMQAFPDIEIVGEASNGQEAVKLVERRRPAVVLMDINMPKLNGIEATARIKSEYPDIAIIGLSVNAESGNQEAMKKAGADMLLTKDSAVDELYKAILSSQASRVP